MRQIAIYLAVFCLLGCNENASIENARLERPVSISRSLPTQDKQYLLEPLEAALDDLREVIENDPGLLFSSSYTVNSNGITGEIGFKLRGVDTVMVDAQIKTASTVERHQYYWDNRGELFLLESTIDHNFPSGDLYESRKYRIYYEEGNERLSAYGKVAYNGQAHSEQWISIELLEEEERHLLRRYRIGLNP